jgi:hypothetical protein
MQAVMESEATDIIDTAPADEAPAIGDTGKRAVLVELDPHVFAITVKAFRGMLDGDGRDHPQAVRALAAPEIERIKAQHEAERAALESGHEVSQLERLERETQQKIGSLADESAALRATVADKAAAGNIAKADRAKLAAISSDIEQHESVLEIIRTKLKTAKATFHSESVALAKKFRVRFETAITEEFAQAREAILAALPWDVLDRLAVKGQTAHDLVRYFSRLSDWLAERQPV